MVKYIKTEDGYKNPKSLELSKFTNDLYGYNEYAPLKQITDEQWVDEGGLHRYENWVGVGPCHYWHTKGKTWFTEVNVSCDRNSTGDLREVDFIVTMKVGNETIKILPSDFNVSIHSSTNFGGSYGLDPSDIHNEFFDIDAVRTKPVCHLWLVVEVLNNSTRVKIYAHTNNPNTFITFDIVSTYIKKIPEDYLNLSNIQSTVDTAQTTANNAQTTANNAHATADNAWTIADNARTTAESALSKAKDPFNFQSNSETINNLSMKIIGTENKYGGYYHRVIKPGTNYTYVGNLIGQVVQYHIQKGSRSITRAFRISNLNSVIDYTQIGDSQYEAKELRVYVPELTSPIFIWNSNREFYFYADGKNNYCEYIKFSTDAFMVQPIFGLGSLQPPHFMMSYSTEGNAIFPNAIYSAGKVVATEEYVDNAVVNKIAAPTTAAIGQTIRVSEVDDTGKPTAWEAVDLVDKEEWTLIADAAVEEEVQSLVYTFADTPLKKMTVMIDTPAASADTTYCPVIIGTAQDANPNFHTVKFYPKAIPTKLAATTVIAAEFIEVGENVYTSVKTTYQPLRGTAIENIGGGSPITSHITRHYVDAYKDQPYPNITRFSIKTYATFPVGTTIKIIGVRA